jgi:hypothetical protein
MARVTRLLLLVSIAAALGMTFVGCTPSSYKLATSCSPEAAGSISPSSGSYDKGVEVDVTATPVAGYSFDHWGGSASGTSATVRLTMDDDKRLTAYFTKLPADEEAVRKAAQESLTYQKFKQWDKDWTMLHPDSQALFKSKEEYVSICRDWEWVLSIKSFTVGDVEIIPEWSFVGDSFSIGTGKTYSNVAEIRITLVYSEASGDREDSRTMHSVKYGGNWVFFAARPNT